MFIKSKKFKELKYYLYKSNYIIKKCSNLVNAKKAIKSKKV